MAYNHVRTAAFIPPEGVTSWPYELNTVHFPEGWRDAVLDFYAKTRSEAKQSRTLEYGIVPISRLNQLLRAVAPGLVSVGAWAPARTEDPWLYSEQPFDVDAMHRYIDVWLEDLAPKEAGTSRAVASSFRPMLDSLKRMDEARLTWEERSVDLLGGSITDSGTFAPNRILYRLLPEYAASRVAAAEPYEHGGRRIRWHRTASRNDGAELISDVLSHVPRGRTHTGKPWYYSGYLRFYLRTEEFSPIPRLYVSCGIHRWVSGKAKFQDNRDISAYLLADANLLPDAPTPSRYSVAALQRIPGTDKAQWRLGGPMGMLGRLALTDHFPDPEILAKEATSALEEGRGPRIALTHHTTMGSHKVADGLMPEERRRLTEWVADALAPDLVPEPDLARVSVSRKTVAPTKALEKASRNDEAAHVRNAERRRAQVAATVPDSLTGLVLYQNPDMRDRLIAAAEASLALGDHREEQGPEYWSWKTPDLSVRLVARQVGALVSRLGGDTTPKRGKEFEAAAAERRDQVKTTVHDIIADSGVDAQLALVELDGAQSSSGKVIFSPRRDPKGAIRSGCAEAGLVSQFIRPIDHELPETTKTTPEDDADQRAKSAWHDGLRQLGTTLMPRFTSEGAIPDDLTQIAFWVVRRNVTSKNPRPQFTPIALLAQGNGPVLGKTPQHPGWVPYPELLRDLTGQLKKDDERTDEQQNALVASFVRSTLYRFKKKNTLVIAEAENIRKQWPWLNNGLIKATGVTLGPANSHRLCTPGDRLRFVKVSSGTRNETPEWWTSGEAPAGFTQGLWRSELDSSGRIFCSIAEKPSSAQTPKEVSKLTPHTAEKTKKETGESYFVDAHNPTKPARTPKILRFALTDLLPDDTPEAWAEFLHLQRDPDDYREDLALPTLLHLAKKSNEYALPYPPEETTEEPAAEDNDKAPKGTSTEAET